MIALNEKQALTYFMGIPESSKFDVDTFGTEDNWRFMYEDLKGRRRYFNDLNTAGTWVIHFITREKHSLATLRLVVARLTKAVLKGNLMYNGYWSENKRDKLILHCDNRVAPLPCEIGLVDEESASALIKENVNLDGNLNIAEVYLGNGKWDEVEKLIMSYPEQGRPMVIRSNE